MKFGISVKMSVKQHFFDHFSLIQVSSSFNKTGRFRTLDAIINRLFEFKIFSNQAKLTYLEKNDGY